jgi:hypothetical protein
MTKRTDAELWAALDEATLDAELDDESELTPEEREQALTKKGGYDIDELNAEADAFFASLPAPASAPASVPLPTPKRTRFVVVRSASRSPRALFSRSASLRLHRPSALRLRPWSARPRSGARPATRATRTAGPRASMTSTTHASLIPRATKRPTSSAPSNRERAPAHGDSPLIARLDPVRQAAPTAPPGRCLHDAPGKSRADHA